jgi:hypothetical protein
MAKCRLNYWESSMKEDGSSMTVGELIEALKEVPRETKIRFQGGLSFYRFKRRGEDLIQVEFNEPVYDALAYYNDQNK